jgi:hypothetical protein
VHLFHPTLLQNRLILERCLQVITKLINITIKEVHMEKIVTFLGIMAFSFTSFAKEANCTFTLQYDLALPTVGSTLNNEEIKSTVNLKKINDREYLGSIKIPTLSYHGPSENEKIIGTQDVSVSIEEKTNRVFLTAFVNSVKVGSSGLNETTLVISTGNGANFELTCSVND